MKYKVMILPIVLAVIFSGCKKASDLTKVRMPYSTQITVPDQLPLVNIPYPFSTPPIPTKTETVLKNEGYNLSLVEKIYLDKLDLVLNSPSGGNIDFLKTIKIYIEADGLPKTLIAQKDVPDSPTNITKVSLDCIQTDLLEYFKKSEVIISSEVTTDKTVFGEHKIDINSVFLIDVNVLGL